MWPKCDKRYEFAIWFGVWLFVILYEITEEDMTRPLTFTSNKRKSLFSKRDSFQRNDGTSLNKNTMCRLSGLLEFTCHCNLDISMPRVSPIGERDREESRIVISYRRVVRVRMHLARACWLFLLRAATRCR